MNNMNPYQGYGRAIKKSMPWAIIGGVAGGFSRFSPLLGYIRLFLILYAIVVGVREMKAARP
jgi:hypothetical protein